MSVGYEINNNMRWLYKILKKYDMADIAVVKHIPFKE